MAACGDKFSALSSKGRQPLHALNPLLLEGGKNQDKVLSSLFQLTLLQSSSAVITSQACEGIYVKTPVDEIKDKRNVSNQRDNQLLSFEHRIKTRFISQLLSHPSLKTITDRIHLLCSKNRRNVSNQGDNQPHLIKTIVIRTSKSRLDSNQGDNPQLACLIHLSRQ
ncbi:hypothetical protein CEXT_782051 [Caerostris extrusa]|uniref:Uncharacterized protein n=1 Tax=Caerostris extrusa TaxID=172846 RepID=A0AAV4VQ17_CAEEX|nr:hypothetical protein CEXT_782051 [Caerostris extrusa]